MAELGSTAVSLFLTEYRRQEANMTDEQWRYEFAFRLRKVMRHRKLTQKQLAQLAGIEEDTLSRYLHRTRIPRIDILIAICDALDCSVDSLTRFDDDHLLSTYYMRQDGIL